MDMSGTTLVCPQNESEETFIPMANAWLVGEERQAMEKPLATVEHRYRTLCISVSQGLNSKVKKKRCL